MSVVAETLEVLINSHDPTTAIKISNDSEASRVINFVQSDKLALKIILNEIDHSTGVITKGVPLGTNQSVSAELRSTDYGTTYASFAAPSESALEGAITGVANVFEIFVNSTDANIAGDYVVIPSVTSGGVETNHLFYFASATTPPPTGTGYKMTRIDITGGTANANLLQTAIHGENEFSASVAGNIVTVTAAQVGALTTEPTVSDTVNLGIGTTQRGVTAVAEKKVNNLTLSGSSISFASGEDFKDAKFLINIDDTTSNPNSQKTVARQDAKVLRSS